MSLLKFLGLLFVLILALRFWPLLIIVLVLMLLQRAVRRADA